MSSYPSASFPSFIKSHFSIHHIKTKNSMEINRPSPIERGPCYDRMVHQEASLLSQFEGFHNRLVACQACQPDPDDPNPRPVPIIQSPEDILLLNTGTNAGIGTLPQGAQDTFWEVGIGDITGPASVTQWIPAVVCGQASPFWSSAAPHTAPQARTTRRESSRSGVRAG